VGIKENSSTKYGETIYDEKNRPIGVEEKSTGTTYGIKYTNKCNQTITVCAIRKTVENSNSKIYYDDVSIVFKPYEVKIEKQSLLMSGFFGQKVEDYFNLNPNYSVKSAKTNEIEYIKIVGKQKPKL
jgi:type III secretory pathway lipoprotein EscJ